MNSIQNARASARVTKLNFNSFSVENNARNYILFEHLFNASLFFEKTRLDQNNEYRYTSGLVTVTEIRVPIYFNDS